MRLRTLLPVLVASMLTTSIALAAPAPVPVPVPASARPPASMPLRADAPTAPDGRADQVRYAAQEQRDRAVQTFAGGSKTVIVVAGSTVALALVILLIVIAL